MNTLSCSRYSLRSRRIKGGVGEEEENSGKGTPATKATSFVCPPIVLR